MTLPRVIKMRRERPVLTAVCSLMKMAFMRIFRMQYGHSRKILSLREILRLRSL